jgi:hypothetical protein
MIRPELAKSKGRVSNQMFLNLRERGGKVEIYSFFPVDRFDCECIGKVNDAKKLFATMNAKEREAYKKKLGHIKCPRADKPGYKKYLIRCADCGAVVAYVAARDKNLTDWCDMHYYNYAQSITVVRRSKVPDTYKSGKKKGQVKTDKKGQTVQIEKEERIPSGKWVGARTPQISPIDGKLGFECFCGNDTRDARDSATLPPGQIQLMLSRREFNRPNSGYLVEEIKNG